MKYFLLILVILFLFGFALYAANEVTVKGGQVTVKGGYVDVNGTVVVSTGAPVNKAGECMGLLCGLTYN